MSVNAEIVTLSRRNTNVRSLALSLNQKGKATGACEESLRAIRAALDGIPAGPMVAGGYHVHAHLTLYVDGTEMWVPAGVGVLHPVVLDPDHPDPVITAAKAFYWLHTHDESGVIHAEAPQKHDFTLGQFFDIWGQPLSRHEVGPAKGDVTVSVDGKRYDGDPRKVRIGDHVQIQLNVGRDVPFVPYDFPPRFG